MKKSKKCFLIDDDIDDQEIFILALSEVTSDTACMVSLTADYALKLLKNTTELPDCIFLDLYLPGMNGYEFLKEIKSDPNLKHIPVIIYTTSSAPDEILKSKKLGADGFFTKSVEYGDLRKMLKGFFADGHQPDGMKTAIRKWTRE